MRYTPTCVGKTIKSELFLATPKVHPHVRGENRVKLGTLLEYRGTPPRAWGKLSAHALKVSDVRYTPTCVGKTYRKRP